MSAHAARHLIVSTWLSSNLGIQRRCVAVLVMYLTSNLIEFENVINKFFLAATMANPPTSGPDQQPLGGFAIAEVKHTSGGHKEQLLCRPTLTNFD